MRSSASKAGVLRRAARLANLRGQWRRAEWLCRRSLRLEDHAATFHLIGMIYARRGEFSQAAEFYHRTLAALRTNADTPLRIDTLLRLADISAWRGWSDQAEGYLLDALRTAEKMDDASISKVLENLFLLYQATDRHEDARSVCERMLARPAVTGSAAGSVWRLQGELEATLGHPRRSQRLLHRALRIHRRLLGETHAEVATDLASLAFVAESQSKLDRADLLYREALSVTEKSAGPDSLESAALLNNLAALAFRRGDGDASERLYRRALRIKERNLGKEHPEVAMTLNNLGVLYKALGRLTEARPLYERALGIFERSLGRTAPQTCECLKNTAWLVEAESKALLARARSLEKEFADVTPLNDLIDAAVAKFRIEARRSPIHDVGVFAAEDIPSGVKVTEYTGKRVPRRNLASRMIRNRTYCVKLDQRTAIDGAVGGSGAQYINHCCDPNLRPVREDGHLFLFSKRAITAGEELTLDYTYPKSVETVPCHCRSPKCRGTINLR